MRRTSAASRRRDDTGETLIELVATIIIMGLGITAMMTGILVATKTSTQDQDQVLGQTTVRSITEDAVRQANVAGSTVFSCPGVAPVVTNPPGWTVTVTVGYMAAQTYSATPTGTAFFTRTYSTVASTCASADTNLRVLEISASKGTLTTPKTVVYVRKVLP